MCIIRNIFQKIFFSQNGKIKELCILQTNIKKNIITISQRTISNQYIILSKRLKLLIINNTKVFSFRAWIIYFSGIELLKNRSRRAGHCCTCCIIVHYSRAIHEHRHRELLGSSESSRRLINIRIHRIKIPPCWRQSRIDHPIAHDNSKTVEVLHSITSRHGTRGWLVSKKGAVVNR